MSIEITFLDADNNIVDAARAVMVVETETDANGNVIRESWNRVVKTNPPRPENPWPRRVLVAVIVILLGLIFASTLFAAQASNAVPFHNGRTLDGAVQQVEKPPARVPFG